jgi:2-keto-4-pentenoate hydratase
MINNDIIEKVIKINKENLNSDAFSKQGYNISEHDAYVIQDCLVNEILINENKHIAGYKVGLTSKDMMDKLKVTYPNYGYMFKSRRIENETIEYEGLINPKIEVEIAFILKEDITQLLTKSELIKKIDYVCASFEIVSCHYNNWDFNNSDMIVDNVFFKYFKLGNKKIKYNEIDLVNENVSLFKNGVKMDSGLGKNCLENPLNSLYFLVESLVKRNKTLRHGDVILSGALCKPLEIELGDEFEAIFDNLNSIKLKFI